MTELRGRFVGRAQIALEVPLELEPFAAGGGRRRVIGVAGGRFTGGGLDAEVLPGGADWQVLQDDGTALVEARYTLRCDDDSELIVVWSRGVRSGPPEVLAALQRGEPVDPVGYYFRTFVSLEAGAGRRDWVNRRLFVAVAERTADAVAYDLYEVL